jgi:tRNA threonylcarbamoyl adenosine modification protein YeaZ
MASVALIAADGKVIASRDRHAPMQASGACIELLDEALYATGMSLQSATLFAADLGPGSFTGVKVAVTLAKTFAFSRRVQCAGADSFDLISPADTVVLPSKKGEWFVRRQGEVPVKQDQLPDEHFRGYGPGIDEPIYPQAANFVRLLSVLEPVQPERLLPNYLIEPSISLPKQPFSQTKAKP